MTIRDRIEQHGPAVLSALRGLAAEYGDDLVAWGVARIRERRRNRAKLAIEEAASARRAMIRDGEEGDGHQ